MLVVVYVKSDEMEGDLLGILYTGFKGKNNASYQLLSEVSGQKLFLTNSFMGLKKDIMSIKENYDLVIMLGLDTSLKEMVRIECVAELNGMEMTTEIDCDAVCRCLTANDIPCFISKTPTRYLCNAAYFHMLKRVSGKAVFIHVPSGKNMSEKMAGKIVKCLAEIR